MATGTKWNEGVIGAAIGGGTYGLVMAVTGNTVAAGFAGAAAEATVNQVLSYVPVLSQANGNETTKQLTIENIATSSANIVADTAVNGTISTITGKIAGKIIPTNHNWFTPQKFVSSFFGHYAVKSELQTAVQSTLITASNIITDDSNKGKNDEEKNNCAETEENLKESADTSDVICISDTSIICRSNQLSMCCF
jgi:hypothetical protein